MASSVAVQGNDSQIGDRIGAGPVSHQRSTCDVRGGAQAAQGAVGGVVDRQGGRPEQAGASTSAREGESRHLGAPVSSSKEIISPGTSQRRSSVLAGQQKSRPDPLVIVKLRKEVEDLKRKVERAADLEEEDKRRKATEEEEKNISEQHKQEKKELEVEKKELTERLSKFSFEKRLAVHILTLKEEIEKPEPDGCPTAVCSEELEKETPQEPFAEQLKQLKTIEKAEAASLAEVILKEHKKRVEKAKLTRWTRWGKPKRSITTLDIENPKLPECYLEIKRLFWVEGQKVLKKALEVWREKELLFTKRVERKKSKVGELKNEVYQLIGFFSVFQGVVLTAVAQASQLHCPTSWIPISLSILASVVTIAGVIQKLFQISAFQKTIHDEELSLKEIIARELTLKRQAESFRFAKFFDNREKSKQQRSQQFFYFACVIISLLFFTVLFPISHWKILCG